MGSLLVCILIDQGSELFITENIVQLHRSAAILLLGIGGIYSGRTRGSVLIQLQSIHDSALSNQIRVYVLSRLTAKLPLFNVRTPSWPHIAELSLADPDYFLSGSIYIIMIYIIIGSDNYHAVIWPGLIQGNSFSPTAQQTIFE